MQTTTIGQMYEKQKGTDELIIREKGLEGQDLLPNTILALQVEIGELANEWRGFKHWSNDREPRVSGLKGDAPYNPMLEEYVDCLSFILSIGQQAGCSEAFCADPIELIDYDSSDVVKAFNDVFKYVTKFRLDLIPLYYWHLTHQFVNLGRMLGFTWEQIVEAYMEKNKINHERQASGY